MKPFITSRKFLLPFIIAFSLYSFYTVASFWSLYKDDIQGKNIPFSDKFDFIWYQFAGNIGSLCFLFAMLIGLTFWSHQRPKDNSKKLPFSIAGLVIITAIALLGFLYTSFYQPLTNYRTVSLLADIYYLKKGETFQRTESGHKNERMLSLPALFSARDSIKKNVIKKRLGILNNIKVNTTEGKVNEIVKDLQSMGMVVNPGEIIKADGSFSGQDSWECCISKRIEYDLKDLENIKKSKKRYDLQVYQKIAYSFSIFLFYVSGVFLGFSLKKVNILFPMLIAHFLIFPLWYFAQTFFQQQYLLGKASLFVGSFGGTIIMLLLVSCCYLFLKRRGNLSII